MKRCGKLYAIDFQLARKFEPLFNGAIGVLIANLSRRQFLQRRREDADLHEPGFEFTSGHGAPFACKIVQNCVRSNYESTVLACSTADYATKSGVAAASANRRAAKLSSGIGGHGPGTIRRRMLILSWTRHRGQRYGPRSDAIGSGRRRFSGRQNPASVTFGASGKGHARIRFE